MRFAIATAGLLLANGEASTDEALANNRIRDTRIKETIGDSRISFYDNSKINNRKGILLRHLGRRLASKKKGKELKLRSIDPQEREASQHFNHADPISPDLGVIGDRNQRTGKRNLRVTNSAIIRTAKESIMDRDSMRESSENPDDVSQTFSTNSPILSSGTSNDEIEESLNEYSSFAIDNLQDICDYRNCDCGDFDIESVNGIIECEIYVNPDGSDYCESSRNYCGEAVELCYRETISLEAIDPETYSYTGCYTYSKPYQQHVCITFDHTSGQEDAYDEVDTNTTEIEEQESFSFTRTTPSSHSCTVQFNNMECNSCSTEIRTLKQYSENLVSGENDIIGIYEERCFNIDCSNVGGEESIINTCDDRRFPNTLRENVLFGDDCTRCQPCGLGHRIRNLDAEGYFPVIGEYMCSGLELAAKAGFFDRDLCPEIQNKTEQYCGCDPNFYDAGLLVSPRIGEVPRGIQTPVSDSDFVPILLPGDTIGDKACDVCGSQTAIVADPDAIVTLPNGVLTSCAALQGAGRLGMFTSAYCRSEVMPLIFRTCGGCFHLGEEYIREPVTIIGASHIEAQPETENMTYVPTADYVSEDTPILIPTEGTFLFPKEDGILPPPDDNVTTPPATENVTEQLFLTPPKNNTFVSCQICADGSVLLPENLVAHNEQLISCRAFADYLASSGAIFTASYCLETARTIIDNDCGGCVTALDDEGSMMMSRNEPDGDRQSKSAESSHSEIPEEIDVGADANNSTDDKPDPNAANGETSSGFFTKPHTTWILVTMIASISSSLMVSFS